MVAHLDGGEIQEQLCIVHWVQVEDSHGVKISGGPFYAVPCNQIVILDHRTPEFHLFQFFLVT